MDEADITVFILWSFALPQLSRIVDDLRTKFELVGAWRITWGDRYAKNVKRLYGIDLPERADKASGSGKGPFHVYVVRDAAPVYEPRPRSWGMHPANVKAYDAKQQYREWTGGGFRVHASNDVKEARRDLFLLFGRTRESFLMAPAIPWETPPVETDSDLVGAHGWASSEQLLTALAVTTDATVESHGPNAVTLRVDDVTRARQIVGGRRVAVGDRTLRVNLRGPGRFRRPTPAVARFLRRTRRRARLEIGRLRATIRGTSSRRDGESS